MAEELRLELLRSGDTSLAGLTGQPSRLLRLLAIHYGKAVPQELALRVLEGTGRATDGVVSEELLPSAVHTAIHRIRKAIGKDRIITKRGSPAVYQLNLMEADWLDWREFDRLVEQGRTALPDDPATAVDALRRAVVLWAGDPEGDLSFAEVTDGYWEPPRGGYRGRLFQAHAQLLDALLRVDKREGLADELDAVAAWQQSDDRARRDEDLWLLRARGCVALGQVSDAIKAYQDCSAAIGRKPSTTFVRLIEAADRGQSAGSELTHFPGVNLERAVGAALQRTRAEILTRGVGGSTRIRVEDLLDEAPGLWVPPRGLQLRSRVPVEDALDEILASTDALSGSIEGNGANPAHKWFVFGPPGIGKSTLGLHLLVRLADHYAEHGRGRIPVVVDLGEYRHVDVAQLCEPDWLLNIIASTLLSRRAAAAWRDSLERQSFFVIVDSVDEFLAGRRPPEVQRLLSAAPVLRQASVVLCRTQAWAQYIQGSELSARFELLELAPWTSGMRDTYVCRYYERFFGEEGREVALSLIDRLRASKDVAQLCSVPVRLNMVLDLAAPKNNRLPDDLDLLNLYGTSLTNTLAIEATRPGSILTAQQKQDLLEEVARRYYDEGSMGEADPHPFESSELREFLATYLSDHPLGALKVEAVAEDLENRSILERAAPGRSGGLDLLRFNHKSFQEYLVAMGAYHSLLRGPGPAYEAMQQYLSPEVGEFLKEFLKRLGRQPRLVHLVATNGKTALERVLRKRADQPKTSDRTRIAVEQLYYYLGNLRVADLQDYLEARLADEGDPWLRRGLVIGMAFSGRTDLVEEYILELRRERESLGDQAPLNRVNIGTKLSYFGDQTFDSARPEHDHGLPGCSRTVETLLYQLGTETERGCWQIDLWSIGDLWRWRPEARDSLRAVLKERAEEVQRLISGLREDPLSRDWRELDEFASIAEECGVEDIR